jgi:hypothetical protein
VPVPRCRFAARSGRPPLACSPWLLLAAAAVLLAPAFTLVLLPGDTSACLCQSPQPPGDPFAVPAFLDPSQGWPGGNGLLPLTTGCASEVVTRGGLTPQSFAWIIASVGRPPPLGA